MKRNAAPTPHTLSQAMRDKLANLDAQQQQAVANAAAPYVQARQSLLEGYATGVGINLESTTHDWKLSDDGKRLEPVEKPKPNRAERRQARKKAS